jgi:hypothetical protein
MKYVIFALALVMSGCCSDRAMSIQVQMRDRINLYQSMSSMAYRASEMDRYHYWRGVADGVAVARDVLDAETARSVLEGD